ncbi:MAG TPA: glycosyl hydrolase family 57 [Kiritimatiellia bacterium]|nr:glycosyl hydrolase family 57 [Kiritimatiellia bacterium]HMP00436.1 glycosyl hydrolase family 57 [Kiritimatiellia bacterium]HMP97335.1 glycosyl hydrolase family 57 [Kiritimatiellia bacterium]
MQASIDTAEGIPQIAGNEEAVLRRAGQAADAYRTAGGVAFDRIKSAAAIALHMQQPLIPAGGGDLRSAAIISNLKHMMDNQTIGDNHNAPVFYWCYKRIGEFVPQLIGEGKQPRAMLEYTGCLFDGLAKMGSQDLFDALRNVTVNPDYRHAVEWLGCPWGHAVAPSTPVQDYKLHVLAWQQHFAALFGMEALERVKGFSPSEMAIPNQPDVAYEFVKTLKDCGFTWVIIQEHTVEKLNGHGIDRPHVPHRLVCRNSKGETASIIALIKTQGSDTKLVAQMQPWYEAASIGRQELAGRSIPPLVTQIADGENGGVMMNEFPGKFMEVVRNASHSDTPLMNGSEYLEHLFALGIKEADLPEIQPLFQHKIWQKTAPGDGPEKLRAAIEECRKEDHRFHMEGGSWTSHISWTNGYENVLGPMDQVSALFSEKVLDAGIRTTDPRYRNALYHLLVTQTSCFRYWGQGVWTDYARELCRRTEDILRHDF